MSKNICEMRLRSGVVDSEAGGPRVFIEISLQCIHFNSTHNSPRKPHESSNALAASPIAVACMICAVAPVTA